MGYKLRRSLRLALGPEVAGLQRAVALEIADDARDETRLSWAALEDIAIWTAAKDVNVVRNALKRLAVVGWEFRVPMGTGKDGRILYAVPGRRLTFRVPDFEEVAPATPLTPEGVAGAHSEGAPARSQGAPARSEGAGATPFSSVPQDSSSLSSAAGWPPEPPVAPSDERETSATPAQPTTAQRLIRSSGVVSIDEEQLFIAWAVAKFDVKGPGWWHKSAGDLPELAEAWRASRSSRSKPGIVLPDWCGECDGPELARRYVDTEAGLVKCKKCNPYVSR